MTALLEQIAIARKTTASLERRLISSISARPQVAKIAPSKPTFAVIFDEFTRECFAPDLNIVQITRANWQSEIESNPVEVLMVESAWAGNNREWRYLVGNVDKPGNPLRQLVEFCRDRKIPTVFWNKEDPVHFDRFSSAAVLFDVIFTTDANSVPRYEALTGKANAFVLPFAAQPLIHNPVRVGSLKARVAFAGSWRGIKYPARGQALDMLLSPLLKSGKLDIFDRMHATTEDPDLIFPEKFRPAIVGSMPYSELVETAYKNYLAFVNVNSVENSETMLARRVFELLACGTPVISSYSPAIDKTFGDKVVMPKTSEEAKAAVDRLQNDLLYRPSLAAKGVRQVHSEHTVQHRIDTIRSAIGQPALTKNLKRVTLICSSKRPSFLAHAASQIKAQTYQEREVIFVAHNESYDEDKIFQEFQGEKNFRVIRNAPDLFLADSLNSALRIAEGDFFAKIDDDDFYAPYYIEDAMRCFDYARGAAVVGKQTYFAYIESANQTVVRFPNKYYRFTTHVAGATLVCDRRQTEALSFERVQRGTDSQFIRECGARGIPIFSSDPFNYLHVRYAEPGQHTWNISDEEFTSKTQLVENGRIDSKIFF
jgi:spore maturation protein CgeB